MGWRKRIRLYRLAIHRPKGTTTGSVSREEGRTHFSLGRQTGLVTISQSRSRLPFGTFIFFFRSSRHFKSVQSAQLSNGNACCFKNACPVLAMRPIVELLDSVVCIESAPS